MNEVIEELKRAKEKFPTWPVDPLHALAIVGEEFGETQKEILQKVYEPAKGSTKETVKAEAIQLAAMALRFLENVENYEFKYCEWRRD